jgi:hypothetical protein
MKILVPVDGCAPALQAVQHSLQLKRCGLLLEEARKLALRAWCVWRR